MFELLARRDPDEQRIATERVLGRRNGAALAVYLASATHRDRETNPLSAFGIEGRAEPDSNPAEAERENALIEYTNALDAKSRAEATKHYATAIRSAVTSMQIEEWMRKHPFAYQKWREGKSFEGPTFLEDESAAKVAETEWLFVEKTLQNFSGLHERPSSRRKGFGDSSEESLYLEWEKSLS